MQQQGRMYENYKRSPLNKSCINGKIKTKTKKRSINIVRDYLVVAVATNIQQRHHISSQTKRGWVWVCVCVWAKGNPWKGKACKTMLQSKTQKINIPFIGIEKTSQKVNRDYRKFIGYVFGYLQIVNMASVFFFFLHFLFTMNRLVNFRNCFKYSLISNMEFFQLNLKLLRLQIKTFRPC